MTMNEEEGLHILAQHIGTVLRERGHKLAAAESCTGGWVCQAVTEVAGSSAWFDCGFVTYSNTAKQQLLGVPGSVLANFGAVSEETVCAMAAGALRNSQADCVVAVSGIAGPTGATQDKPVGTVWFAWQQRAGRFATRRMQFDGDRRSVRGQAVAFALQGILEMYG
jgi:nicotinamide-nucleotide amidase